MYAHSLTVFPIGLMILITVRHFCHFMLIIRHISNKCICELSQKVLHPEFVEMKVIPLSYDVIRFCKNNDLIDLIACTFMHNTTSAIVIAKKTFSVLRQFKLVKPIRQPGERTNKL
jgi:hypothetical protein